MAHALSPTSFSKGLSKHKFLSMLALSGESTDFMHSSLIFLNEASVMAWVRLAKTSNALMSWINFILLFHYHSINFILFNHCHFIQIIHCCFNLIRFAPFHSICIFLCWMLHHSFSNIIIANDLQIDFNKLALLHPELRPHIFILGGRTVINFKNQSSLIVLNQAIMKHVFGLNWNCKIENLCPRIPSRVNYLLWINLHSNVLIKQVVDIGTGSTLIYPLLGWKIFGWKFIATEQNKQSILLA